VLVIRFSAIPSHFSTAVFSTCGVNFWSFAFATFITLPKQIFLVYLGVLLLQDKPDNSAKNIVFGLAFAVTIVMAVYIYWKMRKIKTVLLAEQAESRKARLAQQVVADADESEEGQYLMETGLPRRERDYVPVEQEEMDIGVTGPSGHSPSRDPLGPRYHSDLEYQGSGSRVDLGREPVREQAWV
jgi:hypothetical protein